MDRLFRYLSAEEVVSGLAHLPDPATDRKRKRSVSVFSVLGEIRVTYRRVRVGKNAWFWVGCESTRIS